MDTASPERPRRGEAMAGVPQEPREAIAAMDFFTVPTLTFGVLYCFFVIGHERRKILHFNVMRNPNGLGKDTPGGRPSAIMSPTGREVISWPRLGGLHHRYVVAA